MKSSVIASIHFLLATVAPVVAQIKPADDAPLPLSPADSLASFSLADGFRLELIAAEPLVLEPSGICWNETGDLFVCELHGYNLEGHYDIEELNKTGELDRIVRRIPANEEAKARAEKNSSGVVKRLIDDDGDGRMDRAEVWADDLAPCTGIVAARGGVIVIAAPDIVYLADLDHDGTAETREVLFSGFVPGLLERRMNSPQWGYDNWIYVARGRGGRITGPHLSEPVDLPANDFRFKPDGSSIEPITGGTGTYGFTFDERGNRYVVSTGSPAIMVAPIEWRYLARFPELTTPGLEHNTATSNQTFPTSQPHPWRTRRANDPGFNEYYRSRYGASESTPNGYFTSACGPLVYQDPVLPGLQYQLLACEPAQNMVFRATFLRDGLLPTLVRPEKESESEFLSSTDVWFHPIQLQHAPDGTIAIVDFYREIIEDYSAIPRYLQQQYSLINGAEHGRIWRLTHDEVSPSNKVEMDRWNTEHLATGVVDRLSWHRTTARRLIVERQDADVAAQLKEWLRDAELVDEAAINVLYTLQGLGRLSAADLQVALAYKSASVRVHALRLSESMMDDDQELMAQILRCLDDSSEAVQLQLALSFGESTSKEAFEGLLRIATGEADSPWLDAAVLSSMGKRPADFIIALLKDEARPAIVVPLVQAIGRRRDSAELSAVLPAVIRCDNLALRIAGLTQLADEFKTPVDVVISEEAKNALLRLLDDPIPEVRFAGTQLVIGLRAETAAQHARRIRAMWDIVLDPSQPVEEQVRAVEQLGAENSPEFFDRLIDRFSSATPRLRRALLDTLFARVDNQARMVSALQEGKIPASALNAIQRSLLTESADESVREAASTVLSLTTVVEADLLNRYVSALDETADANRGAVVFEKHCADCHRAHGRGNTVGPDLDAEFRRAEETMVLDLLAPSSQISAGYATYVILTKDGRVFSGILASETAGSLTLVAAKGKTETILRRDIESIQANEISLMPDDLAKSVNPRDVADVIAWLKQPRSRLVLFDEDARFVSQLTEGGGTVECVEDTALNGRYSMRITPLQKHSARIPGWSFPIREHPGPGEYRYLKLAWKCRDSDGPMIELANEGRWPSSDSPSFRYYAGRNATDWRATQVAEAAPSDWTIVIRDLWSDFGDATITGVAPTAMGGEVWFDQIELHRDRPKGDSP